MNYIKGKIIKRRPVASEKATIKAEAVQKSRFSTLDKLIVWKRPASVKKDSTQKVFDEHVDLRWLQVINVTFFLKPDF